MSGREILIETARLGDVMKVSALDPETGLEACAIGPPHARADLEILAVRKLKRLLDTAQGTSPGHVSSKSGKLV